MQTIFMNTDGGARGNPGPAGAGVVIIDASGKVLQQVSKYLGEQTNNWAEYEALVLGLQELKKVISKEKRPQTHIEVRMDSELVVKQLNGEYQIKDEPLQMQFMKVWNLRVSEFPHSVFKHIPREENKEADLLANEAMDKGTEKFL